MASLTDNALILIICLFLFLILSLFTNGVFFSISLYKNIRSKPKEVPKKQVAAARQEPAYVEMSSTQDNETISPYYTKMGPALKPTPTVQSPYANLADMPS